MNSDSQVVNMMKGWGWIGPYQNTVNIEMANLHLFFLSFLLSSSSSGSVDLLLTLDNLAVSFSSIVA